MKSSDPHAVLATLMNNNTDKNKSEAIQDHQRLRLDLWDMPGSASLSDITHQIFVSSRAIYLVVFDLTKDLDQPAEWNKVIWPNIAQGLFTLICRVVGNHQSRPSELSAAFHLLLFGECTSRNDLGRRTRRYSSVTAYSSGRHASQSLQYSDEESHGEWRLRSFTLSGRDDHL